MYYYKFESIDFEEQYAFELTHDEKFTSEDLDNMVIKAIEKYIENDYDPDLPTLPCNLDMGDLFYDETLQNTLVEMFDFKKIEFESKIEYGGEALFADDFRHKTGKNFKEIFENVKVPKCTDCNENKCLIENERF